MREQCCYECTHTTDTIIRCAVCNRSIEGNHDDVCIGETMKDACADRYGDTFDGCGSALRVHEWRDCWIDRNGTQYYVPECGHEHVARKHLTLNGDGSQLERRGWIHFNLDVGVQHWYGVAHTQAQIDTLFDMYKEKMTDTYLMTGEKDILNRVDKCIKGECKS